MTCAGATKNEYDDDLTWIHHCYLVLVSMDDQVAEVFAMQDLTFLCAAQENKTTQTMRRKLQPRARDWAEFGLA